MNKDVTEISTPEQDFWSSVKGKEYIEIDGKKYAGRMVAPNDQELDFLKKSKSKDYYEVPFAIRVRKFNTDEIKNLTTKIVKEEKSGYQTICNNHKHHKFLFHLQLPLGIQLTDEQVRIIHECQEINETPLFLAYGKGSRELSDEYIKRMIAQRQNHKDKKVLPVLDLDSPDLQLLALKTKAIVDNDFDAAVIVYRGMKKSLNVAMPILKKAGIFIFVIGVQPRQTRDDVKASLLAVPFIFGANTSSHGLPWSGGKAVIRFMNREWFYKENKTPVQTSYFQEYSRSRAEAIETANISCRDDLQSKSVPQLIVEIKGFAYFAKRLGISNKR